MQINVYRNVYVVYVQVFIKLIKGIKPVMAQQNNKRTKINQQPNVDYEEDLDQIDFNNYKGMFFDDPGQKYQDPSTGAHFDYYDMCCRLIKLQKSLNQSKREPSHDYQDDVIIKPRERNPLGQLRQLLERRKQKESRNAAQREYGTMKLFQENVHSFNSYIATQNIIPSNHTNNRHNEGNIRSKSTDKGPQNTTFYNAAKKIVNPKVYDTQKDKKKQSLLELYNLLIIYRKKSIKKLLKVDKPSSIPPIGKKQRNQFRGIKQYFDKSRNMLITRTKKTMDEGTSSFIRKGGNTEVMSNKIPDVKGIKGLGYRNRNTLHGIGLERIGESKNLYMTSFLKATELKI